MNQLVRHVLKLATWNVNSLGIRLPHLLAWLAETQPDAVVLQETKLVDEKFPHAELKEAGWHVEFFGQKTYNGVALVSKLPATLPQLIVIVQQLGGLDLESRQLSTKRNVTDQGERILVGTGPGIAAGQSIDLAITGLPHHATWPRYVALSLAGAFMSAGIWAGLTAGTRRRKA